MIPPVEPARSKISECIALMPAGSTATIDSTAAVAAGRQGKNARQLLETAALETGDDGIAVSVMLLWNSAHGISRNGNREHLV